MVGYKIIKKVQYIAPLTCIAHNGWWYVLFACPDVRRAGVVFAFTVQTKHAEDY